MALAFCFSVVLRSNPTAVVHNPTFLLGTTRNLHDSTWTVPNYIFRWSSYHSPNSLSSAFLMIHPYGLFFKSCIDFVHSTMESFHGFLVCKFVCFYLACFSFASYVLFPGMFSPIISFLIHLQGQFPVLKSVLTYNYILTSLILDCSHLHYRYCEVRSLLEASFCTWQTRVGYCIDIWWLESLAWQFFSSCASGVMWSFFKSINISIGSKPNVGISDQSTMSSFHLALYAQSPGFHLWKKG